MNRIVLVLVSAMLFGCHADKEVDTPAPGEWPANGLEKTNGVDVPGQEKTLAPVPAEKAPEPSPRLEGFEKQSVLNTKIETYFKGHTTQRVYVQVDKPLYKPGETIWIRSVHLNTRDWSNAQRGQMVQYELVSPKGAVVLRKRVKIQDGAAHNDFEIPAGAQGGQYVVRAHGGGASGKRKIVVSTYEAPRIKKRLEFVRKAYGAGDTVKATIKIKRPTGEPLGTHPVRGLITLDGARLEPISTTTNAEGGAMLSFVLPEKMAKGDGLLTVLIDDGGVTESVSKRIPIILKKMQLSFFPEGGKLVEGLTSRMYFEAKNTIGKPADVAGQIVDDKGNPVARFTSFDRGLGRFDFTPSTGRTYHAEITQPVGVVEKYPVPLAQPEGCVLRTYDDFDGQEPALRASVRCSRAQTVLVSAMLRERQLDAAAVEVPENASAVVYLKSEEADLAGARGVARVTVFDEDFNPLAERVVFRNRRNGLQVEITPDQKTYVPREQVALTVKTTDASGQPVPAELALSVVDDTVISFADDKKGHLTSTLILQKEVPGKIEDPKFYFDKKKEKSALAMDLLMGTRGWRTFKWRPVFHPSPISLGRIGLSGRAVARNGLRGNRRPRRQAEARRPNGPPPPPAPPPMVRAKPAMAPPPLAPMPPREENEEMVDVEDEPMDRDDIFREPVMAAKPVDRDWAGPKRKRAVHRFDSVRVFPAPDYPVNYAGPRTDFRETVHWAPRVRTGKDGTATVTFHVSDAITSFRVFAEGFGGARLGRAEKVISSKLPFSMAVKLPLEVSEGDTLELPLILSNEQSDSLPISLTASFGDLLTLERPTSLASPQLAGTSRESLYYPVKVTGKRGESTVMFSANAGGLKDEFVRRVNVQPLGFPQLFQASGTLATKAVHEVDLGAATDGTAELTVSVYPGPLSVMTGGLAGLIREPSGCFEQTSSSNYPNVMVLRFLEANGVAEPDLVAKTTQKLARGYARLVGYETKKKGYEWFGASPPHEALTAYGVLQFGDMKGVFDGVDDEMVVRTVAYLKSRRDGKGGFKRNAKALDSFGRAAPEVTDAYITWAVATAGLGGDFDREVKTQLERGLKSKDAYLVALAANTLVHLPAYRAQATDVVARLAKMQGNDGAWTQADHSVTRSTGKNLHIETTSLALLALMAHGGYDAPVRKGVNWLNESRGGFGRWGATQATVLALKAMTEYTRINRVTKGSGRVELVVDGVVVDTQDYAAGRRDPLTLSGAKARLGPGKHRLELRHAGGKELPYAVALSYRSARPASHPDAPIQVTTKLAAETVKMGENVRLEATITNTAAKGQPMTIARIGFPGGLTYQTWQLEELREKGLIAFYETRAREVILYFRQMKPSETKTIPLDLVAGIPGQYTGPASRAYLYYTDDLKHWTAGTRISVTR